MVAGCPPTPSQPPHPPLPIVQLSLCRRLQQPRLMQQLCLGPMQQLSLLHQPSPAQQPPPPLQQLLPQTQQPPQAQQPQQPPQQLLRQARGASLQAAPSRLDRRLNPR